MVNFCLFPTPFILMKNKDSQLQTVHENNKEQKIILSGIIIVNSSQISLRVKDWCWLICVAKVLLSTLQVWVW
jgi:hypothetical protein